MKEGSSLSFSMAVKSQKDQRSFHSLGPCIFSTTPPNAQQTAFKLIYTSLADIGALSFKIFQRTTQI